MSTSRRPSAPAPLVGAMVLVGLEALALVAVGVSELGVLSGDRLTMGITTAVFFGIYGVGLGVCAARLVRLRSWARAPVVLAQLIQLPVAWSFRGGATTWGAVTLAVAALIVLAGVFHPASIRALDAADRTDRSDRSDRSGGQTDQAGQTPG